MNKTGKLALCILLTLAIGSISGIASASGDSGWFAALNKPAFNPPSFLFGPVWTALYVLMGISFYLILKSSKSPLRNRAIVIFLIQLMLNFCWSFLFFKFHIIGIAFIEIILIWISIIIMIVTFYKIDKRASLLQIPYLMWVSFASVLNWSFWMLN